VFHAKDVAALREKLVERGAKFGEVRQGDVFCCATARTPTEILFNCPTASKFRSSPCDRYQVPGEFRN
jgi:hypothetical protein